MTRRDLPLSRWSRALGRFARARGGVAAVELALVAPMLVVLFGGMVELSFYLSAHHRTSQMSSTVADAISRYELIESADVHDILSVSSTVVGERDFAEHGRVIVTSVQRKVGESGPTIAWQCADRGTLSVQSKVGSPKGPAHLPGNLQLEEKDNVIVAEVFYEYRPIFETAGLAKSTFTKTAVFRPRLGALTSDPGC